MHIRKTELHPLIQKDKYKPNDNSQTDDNLSDIRGRAQSLVDEASRAISDAKIKEKAQTIWDSVVNLFR